MTITILVFDFFLTQKQIKNLLKNTAKRYPKKLEAIISER